MLLYVQDANERLKPVPSIPGDRKTLLRLLDRRQQEIDHLTGELCTDYYCVLLRPVGVLLSSVSLSCADEWRNILNKLEMANAEKSNTQSKLDEIMLQDSSAKVCTYAYVFVCTCVFMCAWVSLCVHVFVLLHVYVCMLMTEMILTYS